MTASARIRPRIVLDARAIDALPYGVGRYASEMSRRLPAMRPDWDWHILRIGIPSTRITANATEHRDHFVFDSYAREQQLLRDILDIIKPSLVHSLWFPAAEAARCPRILSAQDTIALKGFREFMNGNLLHQLPWYRRSCKVADHIITPSQASLRDITDIYAVNPSMISIIPHACSDNFKATTPSSISNQRKKHKLPARYIFVSAHYNNSYKNMNVALQAVRHLSSRGKEVPQLVSTGFETPSRDKEWIRLGILPDAELASVLAGAEFMIYPSRAEGFGLPPLEAMTCGVPVICSNAGSLPEVGGNAVFYFDPSNADELASAIKLFLNDPKTRKLYASRGIKRAARFSWKTAAAATIKVYEKVLGDFRGKPQRARCNIDWNTVALAREIPPPVGTPGVATDQDALRELGKHFKEVWNWQKAAETFSAMLTKARKLRQRDHLRSALYHLGECELKLGHNARAAKLLSECLRRNPDHKAAPALLAQATETLAITRKSVNLL